MVAYVNGLPLAVFELKKAGSTDGTREAYDQLMTYQREFGASALAPATFAVATDGITARIGTLFTPWEHMAPWDVDEDGVPVDVADGQALEVLLDGAFDPRRFLDLLANFTAFSREQRRCDRHRAAGQGAPDVRGQQGRGQDHHRGQRRREDRRRLAHPGLGQEHGDGVLRGQGDEGAGAAQPDDRRTYRPHRPGQPVVPHVRGQ